MSEYGWSFWFVLGLFAGVVLVVGTAASVARKTSGYIVPLVFRKTSGDAVTFTLVVPQFKGDPKLTRAECVAEAVRLAPGFWPAASKVAWSADQELAMHEVRWFTAPFPIKETDPGEEP